MDTRDAAINAALVLAAIVATVLLLEGFFRLYLGDPLDYTYENGTWLLEPNQTGVTPPNYQAATVNEHGFRGNYSPSTNDIIFLGDSLTFGYCLRDNETLTRRLETVLEQRFGCDAELVNAGVPGYGVERMIQLYDRTFSGGPADYVVLNVIQGDIIRGKRASSPYYQRRRVARKLLRRSSFLAFLKPRLDALRPLITGKQEMYSERFDEYLEQDKERIAAFNRRLEQQNKTLILHVWIDGDDELEFHGRMDRFAERENIPMIDNYYAAVFEQYSGESQGLYCPDGHPSAVQTRRIADAIASQFYNLTVDACRPPR